MNQKMKQVLIVAGTAAAVGGVIYALKRPRKYSGMKIKKSIVIQRSPEDLYKFWRNFENLARISDILQSVEILDDTRTRWTVAAPGEIPIQWDAEITKDLNNEMIGWRSVEGSDVETAGYVRFERAPGGRGTLVRVAMEYDLPAGRVGAALATLLGKRPGAHVEEMLRRFRQVMETGEAAIAERQFAT